MASREAIAAAIKTIRHNTIAPQGNGAGRISPLAAELMNGSNSYTNTYGPFMPRPSRTFTDGAFSPMSPIQPVPLDNPPPGGMFADPRLWPYQVGWNLPTQPGQEGLKLASFEQLYTLSRRYSVARQCIELRKDEILGLDWEVTLTTDAAKAYKNDHRMMKDFGQRKAEAMRFFNHPDPDFWSFHSFLEALLEEIFVYDALSIIFRPKYGAGLGRGLLGSDLDHIKLISGPTIRPLLNIHGGHPAPPAPAYQQYLYGVPRSDIQSIIRGTDIDDYGMAGSEINTYRADMMLYAPLKPTRETPYGFPPVERALLPIISGLQKQEFQLDYFTEGSVPAVYISPGDPNITPTQIRELQDALNAIAGDPAYHMKVVVLPPGSKTEPQRPIDLSDSFDQLVMNQVCMAFDVQPTEIGIIPNIGGGTQGPSASGIRFQAQAARDIRERKSAKPLLTFLCDIFNLIIQDICGQRDMQFQFEGLVDDEDKQAVTELGVQQVQNGISSIDEVRERLDLPPWGLTETAEPVVFTAQGPVPFSMAPQLIMAAMQGNQQQGSSSGGKGQGTNGGQKTSSTRSRTKQPTVRQAGQTKPNGSHPAPLAPHREGGSPGNTAAAGAIQTPGPRTGGTTGRSSVAGSRKKAVSSELDALKRHLRKGREITTWEPRNIDDYTLGMIAKDIAEGYLIDSAVARAGELLTKEDPEPAPAPNWPGWERDLGLVGQYKEQVADAFHEAENKASQLRKDAATGKMMVSEATLKGLISDELEEIFTRTLNPLWSEAWSLGYAAAKSLVSGEPANFTAKQDGEALNGFLATEGAHWLQKIARTGLGNSTSRAANIARTEVARAINTAALQCYKDHGVAYKHLMVAPDDTCDVCKSAEEDGIIPLDSSFSAGGTLGFCHPQCRCVPAPAHVEFETPMGHLGKSEEDENRVAWLLIRAKDDGDHWRYLLQQRDDGTWGMPGGGCHKGEEGFDAAYRETEEEIGDLPALRVTATLNHVDPDGKQVYLYLCETDKCFTPKLNGSTPEETAGTGWFRRKEVNNLNLTPKFKDDWDHIIRDEINKFLNVNEQGEIDVQQDGGVAQPQPTGANWPIPHRADGTQVGDVQGEPANDWSDGTNSLLAFVGDDTDKFPRQRGVPPHREGGTPAPDDEGPWPKPQTSAQPQGSQVGGNTGVPPKGAGKPVVGSVPAKTPTPMNPSSVPPVAFNPADNVESWSDEDESDVVVPVKKPKKG